MLVLVAVGTVVFHVWSPWWWTPVASNWGSIDDTIILTFWITGVVFTAIVLFMAYCVYRFRYQEGRRADYQPENSNKHAGGKIASGKLQFYKHMFHF